MEVRKIAAIDIGSNAVRLLVTSVIKKCNGDVSVKKIALVRLPIRLGQDVFVKGRISKKNFSRMVDAMKSYRYIMRVHGVEEYRAMATSAMRDAENGEELVEVIKEKAKLDVEIIDGKKEAKIIFSTNILDLIRKDKSYVYIDVGGGSTEITIFSDNKIVGTKSFKIGTVRLLNNKVEDNVWAKIQEWIVDKTKDVKNIEAIGTGGNINKIFKMSGRETGDTISSVQLEAKLTYLSSYTYEERIEELKLNFDRADVIVPATKIYLLVMEWSGAKQMHVPKIGLTDGIIRGIYTNEI
ncbi:MAG: exopolyphosphatase [Ichthyobacteriaceae bacterium]|nr:exopolyphosphatase [Ichthyobacteriaceae bacterium]